ncbi:carboxypeptidase-like regulatory domain-containing protein [Enterovibrio baiacu]|uniref:carboxypeptidase-like regulatory domain-containing protein n=1 Tax=Enterovibrio baiacu TaxID=2491023 RepID=UPI003D0BBB69
MKYSSLCLFLLSSLLLIVSGYLHASDEFDDDLFDAHIEVHVGQAGDNFYSVRMDEDEQPYLSLDDAIFSLIDMAGECSAGVCEAYLPQDIRRESPPFVIDTNNVRCYRGDAEQQNVTLKDHSGDVLIHWKSMAACFPIKVMWSIDDYRLNIEPLFTSSAELRKKAKLLIETTRREAKAIALQAQKPAINPEEGVGISSRFSITSAYHSRTDQDFSVLSDSLLRTQYSHSRLSIDSRESHPFVYYNVELHDEKHERSFQFGHVLLDGGIFSRPQTLDNGLYYTNRKQRVESGRVQLERTTDPNINVDVLVNGIYQNAYQADDFGRFVIEESNIAPGDVLTFRYYLDNGSWLDEQVVVAGLDEAFLMQGQWGVDLVANGDGDHEAAAVVEYGIDSYLTAGGTVFTSESENILALQVRYLPAHWIAGYVGLVPAQHHYPVELEILLDTHQSLSIEWNKSDVFTSSEDIYDSIKYYLSLEGVSFNANLRREDDLYRAVSRINTKVAKNLFLAVESDYTASRDTQDHESLFRVELTKSGFSNTSWRLKTQCDDHGRFLQTDASFRHSCKGCRLGGVFKTDNVITNISSSYRNNDYDVHASIEARLNPNWLITFYGSSDGGGIELTAQFGAKAYFNDRQPIDVDAFFSSAEFEYTDWDKYDAAKLKGRVVDANGNGVANVGVKVMNQHTKTQEDGQFELLDVPVRDNLPVFIDEGSLDLNLMPKQNPVFVNTRKVAVTELTIAMVSSFGIDGYLQGDFPSGGYLHFLHTETQLAYSSEIDGDGFFMAEGLTPGRYIVTLDVGGKETALETSLEGDFWISGLTFEASNFR